MAEVLGTISAALQVAELGGRLSVKLCTFAHKFKNADKALRSLSNDVALTCSVLRQLGDSLRQDDLVSLYSPDAFATAQDVLEECKKVFNDLESEIEQQHADPSSKSRIERATRKIWFLMNEPRLDAVAGNLERLKSTMLLMLNVVIYAGQLRSRHEVSQAQEQRELLQMLAVEKIESERKFEQLTTSIQVFNLNIENHGNGTPFPTQDSGKANDELQHYYDMIKAILNTIDTAGRFLDEGRYRRLKAGFSAVHSGEAVRLKETYGTRASHLFSQLKITPIPHEAKTIQKPPQPQGPPPRAMPPRLPSKKRKKASTSHSIAMTNPRQENPAESLLPEMPTTVVHQPFKSKSNNESYSDLCFSDTAFNLDLSALDNPDLLESFDFDTFLNKEADGTGFGFDPNMSLDIDPLETTAEQKQQIYGNLKGPSAADDTSLENPDVWILRWTTLEKTELRQ
ncbi:hypothetical protein N7481_009504 [Penicillium waksmanii]|uniref:uncharacterized protein n=1 Tax=Penicillium waksmanii TaxID=69791 RepID=UPI002548877E|nr:uncharacterized protein N7481_009504 [Penicillium waksmanii]KAJ5975797.1 hypothetical protein N7481_009504 [Penicillium waksmanii]